MSQKILRILVFSVFVLSMVSGLFAQSGQTGSLKGTAADEEGVVLPGVSVTIKSPAIILPQMSTVTNEQGIYRFPSLAPGIYEIIFEMDSMDTLVRRDIKISAGQTITVNVVMRFKSLQESILVVGQSPTIDVQSTTRTTVLDKELLHAIPSARSLDSYFNMTPGVVAEEYSIGPMSSSHGAGVRDNSFSLDGVNISDPIFGTQIIEFGIDIMEELSIQSGGVSAEYGDALGTFVNVITKSGGNDLSGSASIYYSHDSLQASNTKDTPFEGSESGIKYSVEPVITLGGPLVKDKLWFFTNLSFAKSRRYVPGYPYDQDTEIAPDQFRPFPYLKFTFQSDHSNRFALSYNYSDLRENHRGATQFDTESTSLKLEQPSHVINMQWTRMFSRDFFMNFKIGYSNTQINLLPKTEEPWYYDLATGLGSGSYGLDDRRKQYRLQLNIDGTYFIDDWAGSHELKTGGEFQVTESTNNYTPMKDPQNDMTFILSYFGIPMLGYWIDGYEKKEATTNYFAFVQDTWSPVKRLTFNIGLRLSHQRSRIPKQNEDEGPIDFFGIPVNRSVPESFTPITRTNLSPRVGFAYDITGDGKTLLKASFSRYIQPNVQQYFWASNPNGPLAYLQLLMPDGTPIPGFYLDFMYPQVAKTEYNGEKAKSPYTDEVTVSFERELIEDFSLGIRYMKKWGRNFLEDIDANQLDIDKLLNDGELVWTNWEQISFTDPYDGSQQIVWNRLQVLPKDKYLLNPPGADRDYDALEVTLSKRFSHGWSLMASYVYQNSRGLIGSSFLNSWGQQPLYDNPNAHTNAAGKLELSSPHQLKILGAVQGPLGIHISGFFRYLSGYRYTRTVEVLDLGIPVNQELETILAEKRGSRGLPNLVILDLRLEKAFRFRTSSLSIFADGFNIFNGNKATSVITSSSSPELTFEEMTSIQAPRLFRLGMKFEF